MPTYLELAVWADLFGTSLVLALSLITLRKVQEPFFRSWTWSYVFGVLSMLAGYPMVMGRFTPASCLLNMAAGSVAAFLLLRMGHELRERAFPTRAYTIGWVLLFALGFGLLAGTGNPGIALAPLVVATVAIMFWLGVLMIGLGRTPAYTGMRWLAGPWFARSLWLLMYPLLLGRDRLWLGFLVDAALEITVGTGMVVFNLERTVAQLAARNRSLEEAEGNLRAARADLASGRHALATEKAVLDAVLQNVPAHVMLVDRSFRVAWANDAFSRDMGVPPDELIGRSIYDVAIGMPNPNTRLEAVFNDGQPARFPRLPRLRRLKGEDVPMMLDVTFVPLFDAQHQVYAVLTLALDASAEAEREQLQKERIERLQELDRLKRDFLNAASHELRTPLTSILGFAEFLDDEIGGPLTAEQRAFVEQIREGTYRLMRIVDDMLDFARLEAGTFQLVAQPIDVRTLVQDETASVEPQARKKNIALEAVVPDGPVPAVADPLRIGQVVLNLLSNAIKFTPEGGRIRVSAHLREQDVCIEVADTGIGIPSEHLDRLFEKFYQVDPSTTREHGGAGLGLSISKALVEAHGGCIGAESEPGRGSTFWFTLPRQPGA